MAAQEGQPGMLLADGLQNGAEGNAGVRDEVLVAQQAEAAEPAAAQQVQRQVARVETQHATPGAQPGQVIVAGSDSSTPPGTLPRVRDRATVPHELEYVQLDAGKRGEHEAVARLLAGVHHHPCPRDQGGGPQQRGHRAAVVGQVAAERGPERGKQQARLGRPLLHPPPQGLDPAEVQPGRRRAGGTQHLVPEGTGGERRAAAAPVVLDEADTPDIGDLAHRDEPRHPAQHPVEQRAAAAAHPADEQDLERRKTRRVRHSRLSWHGGRRAHFRESTLGCRYTSGCSPTPRIASCPAGRSGA